MRPLCLLLLSLSLSACVTLEERRGNWYAQNDAWIGRKADDLVLKLGIPGKTMELSDKSTLYQYDHTATYSSGGYNYTTYQRVKAGDQWISVPVNNYTPPTRYTTSCRLVFKINTAKKVESWSSEGDGCY